VIFDKFARAVERGGVELIDLLQKTRLFWFPYRAQDVLPKDLTDEFVELNRESFHLPFKHIAIEDKASLVFLGDRKDNQTGLQGRRDFLEVMSIHAAIDNFREGGGMAGAEKKMFQEGLKHQWPQGAMIVSWGVLKDLLIGQGPDKNKISIDAVVNGMAWCTPDGKWDSLDKELGLMTKYDQSAFSATVRNVAVAMQEVMFFNQPCRFILECTPDAALKRRRRKPGRKAKDKREAKDRIARTHERSTYTLLKPTEIRKVLQLPEPSAGGPKKRPHARRRHFRMLRSEKFVHKRWQTVVIPATWIGKSETKVGKKRYKVLLDR